MKKTPKPLQWNTPEELIKAFSNVVDKKTIKQVGSAIEPIILRQKKLFISLAFAFPDTIELSRPIITSRPELNIGEMRMARISFKQQSEEHHA
jgi:hypothetical protein